MQVLLQPDQSAGETFAKTKNAAADTPKNVGTKTKYVKADTQRMLVQRQVQKTIVLPLQTQTNECKQNCIQFGV